MTYKTLSIAALLTSFTMLPACGSTLDDPLANDDGVASFEGDADDEDGEVEEVATAESAATAAAGVRKKSGAPLKVTDPQCRDEALPLAKIAVNGTAFTFTPIAKSNLGWCQKWIFEAKKCKWKVAKCACSGGPECKMQKVQGCFNFHAECNAATKEACDNCPATCDKTGLGCF